MATLEQLEAQQVLSRVSMRVAPIVREIWLFKDVENWFRGELPKLKSFYQDETSTPIQQAWTLLGAFLRGEDMFEDEDFRLMKPIEGDVYELRTPDLRLFGWFAEPKRFVVGAVDTFERVHSNDLHAGHMNEVIRLRNELDLDEPKFVAGAVPKDVL